jgi:hypothetical protein
MSTLSEILSQKAADFDAVKEARELRAVLDRMAASTPATDELIRKTDNPEPSPVSDQSMEEFRKLTPSGEPQ